MMVAVQKAYWLLYLRCIDSWNLLSSGESISKSSQNPGYPSSLSKHSRSKESFIWVWNKPISINQAKPLKGPSSRSARDHWPAKRRKFQFAIAKIFGLLVLKRDCSGSNRFRPVSGFDVRGKRSISHVGLWIFDHRTIGKWVVDGYKSAFIVLHIRE